MAVGLMGVLDNRGAVLIEFAIVVPILSLLMVGAFDLSIATISGTRLQFATEAASRCRAIAAAPCPDEAATKLYAATVSGLSGVSATNFSVQTVACGTQVAGQYSYAGVILPAIPLSATSCYP
jgi:Flp pilus assembly protein TadG